MPVQLISTHWDQDLVETRVTVSSGRLNDLLRILAEASNRHEEEIENLKKQLAEQTARTEKIEADVDSVKPDGEKQKAVDDAIDNLTTLLERMRRDFEHRLDTGFKTNKQQHEAFDEGINALKDETLKQSLLIKELTKNNAASIAENKAKLDSMRTLSNDVTGLNNDMSSMKGWRADANDRLLTCTRFVRLWGVSRDNLEQLCGGRYSTRGVGGDVEPESMLASGYGRPVSPPPQVPNRSNMAASAGVAAGGASETTTAAENTTANEDGGIRTSPPTGGSHTPPSSQLKRGSPPPRQGSAPLKGAPPGVAGPGGIDTDRTMYLHSLPAFDGLWTYHHKVEKKTNEYIDYKTQVLGHKLTEKVGKHEIAELANELKDQHSQVRQTVDFLDRRLKEQDELQGRVVKTEEQIRFMHHNKAEISALDLKADVGIVQEISGEVVDMKEDLNDIFARLQAQGSRSSRQIDDAGRLSQHNSIVGGINADPRGLSATALAASSSIAGSSGTNTPTGHTVNNKRFTDFAEMIASLERRKADRYELTNMQEYLERLENRMSTGGGGGSGPGGRGGGGVTDGSVMSRVTPTSGNMTPKKPSTADGSGGNAAGRGRSPNRSHRDDGAAGTDTGAKRPGTGGSSKGRLGSAGSHHSKGGSLGDSRMEGHSVGTPIDNEPGDARVRPFLGRGLVGVRDSGGSCIPATIGFHRPQYIFKEAPDDGEGGGSGDEQ